MCVCVEAKTQFNERQPHHENKEIHNYTVRIYVQYNTNVHNITEFGACSYIVVAGVVHVLTV